MADPRKPQEYHRLPDNTPPLKGQPPPKAGPPPIGRPGPPVAPPRPPKPNPHFSAPRPRYVTRGEGVKGRVKAANLRASKRLMEYRVNEPNRGRGKA